MMTDPNFNIDEFIRDITISNVISAETPSSIFFNELTKMISNSEVKWVGNDDIYNDLYFIDENNESIIEIDKQRVLFIRDSKIYRKSNKIGWDRSIYLQVVRHILIKIIGFNIERPYSFLLKYDSSIPHKLRNVDGVICKNYIIEIGK